MLTTTYNDPLKALAEETFPEYAAEHDIPTTRIKPSAGDPYLFHSENVD